MLQASAWSTAAAERMFRRAGEPDEARASRASQPDRYDALDAPEDKSLTLQHILPLAQRM
jgi:hypothetical protein